MHSNHCISTKRSRSYLLGMEGEAQWRVFKLREDDRSLQRVKEFCEHMVESRLHDHIWHEEPFHLSVDSTNSCLRGCLRYGDAVDDEWLVVSMLIEITAKDTNLAAQVWDEDGEFLLIEAADSLPHWAQKPEKTVNRVWFACGELQLIPPEATNGQEGPISTGQAMKALHDCDCTAPEGVRGDVMQRLKGFPEKVLNATHRAVCILPVRVANVLKQEPQLVSHAVRAMRERDPKNMRRAVRMKRFPPDVTVTCSILFTKLLFAQLEGTQFEPPRGWPTPPRGNRWHNAAVRGAKLTTGMEMCFEDWRRMGVLRTEGAEGDEQGTEDEGDAILSHDPGWKRYKEHLEEMGYFQGEAEGSKAHTRLLKVAKEHYRATQEHQMRLAGIVRPARRAEELSQVAVDAEEVEERGAVGDDESWLDQGEALLEQAERAHGVSGEDALGRMATEVKEFVESFGDIEGAEMPDEGAGGSFDVHGFFEELSRALKVDLHGSERCDGEGKDGQEEEEEDGDASSSSDSLPDRRKQHTANEEELRADEFMREYEECMGEELSNAGKVFQQSQGGGKEPSERDPVSIDSSLVQGFLDSYSAQGGDPGPVSTLLGRMGLNVPEGNNRNK